MVLPEQRRVMPFLSLPGVQLLFTGTKLPQALFHRHQARSDAHRGPQMVLHVSVGAAERGLC